MRRVLAALIALTVVSVAAGCGGATDRSSSIASQIGGGASCSPSGYGLIDKASGKKTAIYDCFTSAGKSMCVTEQNDIVQDQTVVVRLLFASSLSGKPACIGG